MKIIYRVSFILLYLITLILLFLAVLITPFEWIFTGKMKILDRAAFEESTIIHKLIDKIIDKL